MSDRCSFRKKKSLNNIAFTTIIGKILNLNGNYMYSMSFRKAEEADQRGGEADSDTWHRQRSSSWERLQGQGRAAELGVLGGGGALPAGRLPSPQTSASSRCFSSRMGAS